MDVGKISQYSPLLINSAVMTRKGRNQFPEHAWRAEANFRDDHGQRN